MRATRPPICKRFPEILLSLDRMDLDCEVIYLDALGPTLVKRFSETRRRHPLTNETTDLRQAIEAEHELLASIADLADLVIDTTHLATPALIDLISARIASKTTSGLSLLFRSFGFKFGIPVDGDLVFDIRCLPNPHYVPELRRLTGKDEAVREYLEADADVLAMYDDIRHYLETWLPKFEQNNRIYMTVAIGCTGGQHRSVYMAEKLGAPFSQHHPERAGTPPRTGATHLKPHLKPHLTMQERTRHIVNKLGLHARAASKFVNLAKRFASRRSRSCDAAKTVDGKSIMSIMLLAASQGPQIGLRIEGDDEAECDAGDHRPDRRPVRRRGMTRSRQPATVIPSISIDPVTTLPRWSGSSPRPDQRPVHVGELSGDRDLVDRMHDLAVRNPESRRAARIVTCYDVHALADQFGHQHAFLNAPDQFGNRLDSDPRPARCVRRRSWRSSSCRRRRAE